MTESLEHLASVMSCYECPLLYECHGEDLSNPQNKYLVNPHPWRVRPERYIVGDCQKSSGGLTAGLIPVDDAMAHVSKEPYKRARIRDLPKKTQDVLKLFRWMVRNNHHPDFVKAEA